MNNQEIKKFLDSEAGRSVKEYLVSKLLELKSIDNLKVLETPTHQMIELKSQKKAFEKLKDILSEILTIEAISESDGEKDQFYSM